MTDRRTVRSVLAVTAALTVAFASLMPALAVAQDATPTTVAGASAPTYDAQPPASIPSIIPLPNSGAEPQQEGDRGSATQYAVMFGTMGAMAVIVVLVRREGRRKRALRDEAGTTGRLRVHH